jgi:hypothetical protein
MLVTLVMAGDGAEEMFEVCQRTAGIEDDEEFRETVEHVLAAVGLSVHDRPPGGPTVLRRDGIDPEEQTS